MLEATLKLEIWLKAATHKWLAISCEILPVLRWQLLRLFPSTHLVKCECRWNHSMKVRSSSLKAAFATTRGVCVALTSAVQRRIHAAALNLTVAAKPGAHAFVLAVATYVLWTQAPCAKFKHRLAAVSVPARFLRITPFLPSSDATSSLASQSLECA
eukprot:s912_g15.t1